MKKLSLFILAVILVSVYACTKREPLCCGPTPVPNATSLTAQRNGVAWRPMIVKATLSNDTITIGSLGIASQTSTTFLLDSLLLKIKYTAPGNYALTGNQAIYYTSVSAQFPYNNTDPLKSYQLDGSFNNAINITSYDPTNNKLTATFNLKFTDPANSTGISLLSGKFSALLTK